jgi:pimeloyl-ACP methyl ester carboxylesterase
MPKLTRHPYQRGQSGQKPFSWLNLSADGNFPRDPGSSTDVTTPDLVTSRSWASLRIHNLGRMVAMQTHMLPVSLPWGKNGRAYWSLEPTGDVVVFVHGFNGAAVETWSDFDSMLPDNVHHDVVFYGYDSLRLRATVAAAQLREFLSVLCCDSATTVNSTLEPELYRASSFVVRRVILVGHSLGAVICRRALLDARNSSEAWTSRVNLVFFAPAHMGAHLLSLATGILGALRIPLAPIAKWQFPILSELQEGSSFLKDLREETQQAISGGSSDFLRARAVAICERDNIVNPQTFCPHDASPVVVPKDHVSICKPNEEYMTPLELVAKVVQA